MERQERRALLCSTNASPGAAGAVWSGVLTTIRIGGNESLKTCQVLSPVRTDNIDGRSGRQHGWHDSDLVPTCRGTDGPLTRSGPSPLARQRRSLAGGPRDVSKELLSSRLSRRSRAGRSWLSAGRPSTTAASLLEGQTCFRFPQPVDAHSIHPVQ